MTTLTASGRGTHAPRLVFAAVVGVGLAFLVQSAVLPALGLPSAVPVVFATVVVLAMAWGTGPGAAVGFGAGLLLDLTGSGVLGVGALVGCLLGVLGARIPQDRWRWSGVGWAVLAAAGAALADTTLNAVLQGRLPAASRWWLQVLVGAAVCMVVLLPARGWLRAVVR